MDRLCAPEQPWSFGLLHALIQEASLQRADASLSFLEGAGDCTLTYAEIDALSQRVAAALQDSGASEGARVALFMDNSWEFVVALLACSHAGAVAVPINTAMRGQSLRHVLSQTQPVSIIIECGMWPAVAEHVEVVDRVPEIVTVGEPTVGSDLPGRDFGVLTGATGALRPTTTRPGDPACILYTSGSTGPPKGVVCTHAMMTAWAGSAQVVMGYGPDDNVFVALPLFHANALCCSLLPALGAGASMTIARSFSASAFWHQISQSRATTVNLLGVMEAILRRTQPSQDPPEHHLRLSLVIPPPADPAEFRKWFGVPATTLYGLTDSGIPIGVPHGTPLPAERCGISMPWWETQLVDENDDPIDEPYQSGELVIRPRQSHIMMTEYLAEPSATVTAWRGLWFHTGDRMWRAEDGWFHFVGRESDSMRRGGENVSAYEVEQVLLAHEAVQKAAVFGVPSEIYGEEIMAVVQSPGFETGTLESLIAHCTSNLPYFAVPRYVRVLPDLPMTASEKIAKSLLKRDGIQPDTIDLGERKVRRRAG